MDEELIQEYLRRFDKEFSLLKREKESKWFIYLTEDFLCDNQQEFADRMLHGGNRDSEVFSSGALIFYGYRLGAVRLKEKNECYTRQGGYKDNAIKNYNLDEILDEEIEEDNMDVSTSHIIKWITNPGSNTDVAETVFSTMIVPLVKNLCKTTPPGKRMECTVVMPPISKNIEIQDWSTLFACVKTKELKINLVNYGHLLQIGEDERKYVLQSHTDGFQEYFIVSAYEMIRGHNTCLGCMAFDVKDNDRKYKLYDIKPISFYIDNREEKYEKKTKHKTIADWKYIDCKYPVNNGFTSFLGNHEASFGRELYKISDITGNSDISAIGSVFHGREALQTIEVCARLMQEHNLYNIALGDLVYIASILQKDKSFKTVSIETGKKYNLGTYKQFASFVDVNMLHKIPANYASFEWKLHDKRNTLIPYFSLDVEIHSEKEIIETVVDYFEHCTTEMVAEELLYLYKNGEDPSAFFVAKVFMYLSQMDSIEIVSRNEIVTSIENVDHIAYQEIDKAYIKVNKGKKRVKNNSTQMITIFKQDARTSMLIDEMKLTVRSYNCLRRAGIKTAGDLAKMTRKDLMKVRNLKMTLQKEVINELHKIGLKLADE